MERLLRLARHLANLGVWLGGILLIAAALVIGVEVLARKLLNLSTGGADELAGFAMAIGIAWALPLALLDRAHIRVDSLYVLLPVRVAAVLDLLGLLAFIVFFGVVAWFGWGVFATSYRVGARSLSALGIPLAVPQFVWVVGLVVFLLVATLLFVRALGLLMAGEVGAVRALVGSRSASDETEEELRDVERRRSEG